MKENNQWELIQIQITPELQGNGLGRSILQRLLAEAFQAQSAVRWSVLKTNPARRLYERLGFQVIGENGYSYEMQFEVLQKK